MRVGMIKADCDFILHFFNIKSADKVCSQWWRNDQREATPSMSCALNNGKQTPLRVAVQ